MSLYELVAITFNTCLWVLDNFEGIKETTLASTLDLLLELLAGPPSLFDNDSGNLAAKEFLEKSDDQQIWKLVFLSLKLRS